MNTIFMLLSLGLQALSALVLGVGALAGLFVLQEEPVTFDTAAAASISYTPLKAVVPGGDIPADLGLMGSNNNVDLVAFEGRTFMAFRTAPTHFASTRTRMIILSSADRVTWETETAFGLGSDVREPRFLVFQGKLFLYFFQAGASPFGFEPQHIYGMQRRAMGNWTEPKPVFKPGYVVWRAKTFRDTAYMSVYLGAGLYTTGDRPGDLRLLTSNDGWDWQSISEQPQVTDVSAEEGEFEFDDAGNLVATVRLETHGGLLCTASHDNLAQWTCTYTPYKYDSALMFRHKSTFYLIARRNVAGPFETETGDRGQTPKSEATVVGEPALSEADFGVSPRYSHRALRMLAYWLTRKRTCLYRIDLDQRAIVPVLDFPSKGDTAYPGLIPLDTDSYYLVNYSSPLDGPDWPWLGGQLTGTRIYETVLTFKN